MGAASDTAIGVTVPADIKMVRKVRARYFPSAFCISSRS